MIIDLEPEAKPLTSLPTLVSGTVLALSANDIEMADQVWRRSMRFGSRLPKLVYSAAERQSYYDMQDLNLVAVEQAAKDVLNVPIEYLNAQGMADQLTQEYWLASNFEVMRRLVNLVFNNQASAQILGLNFRARSIDQTSAIGSDSTNGAVLLNSFLGAEKMLLIKYNQDATRDEDHELEREALIGLYLNQLRTECPNFMYTYGVFYCLPERKIVGKEYVISPCFNDAVSPNASKKCYLAIEVIKDSIDLHDALRNTTIRSRNFLNLWLQLVLALCLAKERLGFRHNDLHAGNILVRTVKPIKLEYNVAGNKIAFSTNIIATMIDFGNAIINDSAPTIGQFIQPCHILNDIFILTTHFAFYCHSDVVRKFANNILLWFTPEARKLKSMMPKVWPILPVNTTATVASFLNMALYRADTWVPGINVKTNNMTPGYPNVNLGASNIFDNFYDQKITNGSLLLERDYPENYINKPFIITASRANFIRLHHQVNDAVKAFDVLLAKYKNTNIQKVRESIVAEINNIIETMNLIAVKAKQEIDILEKLGDTSLKKYLADFRSNLIYVINSVKQKM